MKLFILFLILSSAYHTITYTVKYDCGSTGSTKNYMIYSKNDKRNKYLICLSKHSIFYDKNNNPSIIIPNDNSHFYIDDYYIKLDNNIVYVIKENYLYKYNFSDELCYENGIKKLEKELDEIKENSKYIEKIEIIYPNGMKTTTVFEANRDLITEIKTQNENIVENQNSENFISKYSYQNDALGRRINQAKSGTAVPTAGTIDYAYNSRSEVTAANSPNQNFGFSYDNLGNRISAPNSEKNKNYTTNNLNQYINISEAAAVAETSNPGSQSMGNEVLSHASIF